MNIFNFEFKYVRGLSVQEWFTQLTSEDVGREFIVDKIEGRFTTGWEEGNTVLFTLRASHPTFVLVGGTLPCYRFSNVPNNDRIFLIPK